MVSHFDGRLQEKNLQIKVSDTNRINFSDLWSQANSSRKHYVRDPIVNYVIDVMHHLGLLMYWTIWVSTDVLNYLGLYWCTELLGSLLMYWTIWVSTDVLNYLGLF
jgi:hypothetical protein